MIAFLKGQLFEKKSDSVVLNVSGVGYRVFCPVRILQSLKNGDEIFLFIFHRIKEDSEDLFGFLKKEDLSFFEQFLSISGVGPKTALEILEYPISHISTAVEEENVDFFSNIKGIGKKTASRILLEIKGRLPVFTSNGKVLEKHDAIISALENLGFHREKIIKTLAALPEEIHKNEESILRWALKNL